MPTYVYTCEDCEVSIELVRKISERDDPIPDSCMCAVPAWKKEMFAPMVMRESYPDGKKRFGHLKENLEIKKAVASARETGDRKEEKYLKGKLRKDK